MLLEASFEASYGGASKVSKGNQVSAELVGLGNHGNGLLHNPHAVQILLLCGHKQLLQNSQHKGIFKNIRY